MVPDENGILQKLLKLGLLGVIASVGALLVSTDTITIRTTVGTVLSGFTLGIASTVLLVAVPHADDVALMGVACALGLLGVPGLREVILSKRKRNES